MHAALAASPLPESVHVDGGRPALGRLEQAQVGVAGEVGVDAALPGNKGEIWLIV